MIQVRYLSHHDDFLLAIPELGVPEDPRHLRIDVELPLAGDTAGHASPTRRRPAAAAAAIVPLSSEKK